MNNNRLLSKLTGLGLFRRNQEIIRRNTRDFRTKNFDPHRHLPKVHVERSLVKRNPVTVVYRTKKHGNTGSYICDTVVRRPGRLHLLHARRPYQPITLVPHYAASVL